MKHHHALLAAAFLVTASFGAASVEATPITGNANFAGNVNVSRSTISFAPTFTSTANASETEDFSGLTGGTIQSLSGGPATGTTVFQAFATFSTGVAAPIYFDLTYIAPGVGTANDCNSAALGAVCTPKGSPFTLVQMPNNTVLAALQLSGKLYKDSSASGYSTANGVFSTQTTVSGTIPQIVALLQGGQTLTGITYSASFSAADAPVPEPTSLGLLGLELVGASFLVRRKA